MQHSGATSSSQPCHVGWRSLTILSTWMALSLQLEVVNATRRIPSAQFSKRQMQDATTETLFSGCNLEDYYSPLLSAQPSGNLLLSTRNAIHDLLQDTHRRPLPYTGSNGNDDVWMALMDLDAGAPIVTGSSSIPTVHLIYADINVSAIDHGTADTWNREHLWPKSLGVGDGGPDFSDIHHLRPADWNVNAARSNLYFGICGLVKDVANCRQPATAEAASDTAMDGMVFLPPAHRRGDIARALFYMDLRYDGSDGGLDLELTDCPNINTSSANINQMAYLSQLLEWHELDPVDDEERTRNDKACGRWQGNRNIFVDYPELVEAMFGNPQPFPSNAQGYSSCSNSNNGASRTPSPTSMSTSTNGGSSSSSSSSSPTPTPFSNEGSNNSCSDLSAGDVALIAFDSDDPDMVAFVALEDLAPGLVLYMTDNAWTGNGFLTNEGTVMLTVPAGGIQQGTVFGYGASSLSYSSDWKSVSGTFALAAKGDTIILYCMDQEAVLKPLSAVTFGSTGWSETGAVSYETDQSALPPAGLTNGDNGDMIGLALPHLDNYIYNGSTSGTKSQLQTSLGNSNNWMGSNDVGQLPLPDTLSFDIVTITSLGLGPDQENGEPDVAAVDEGAADAAVDASLWMSLLCMVVLLAFLMEDNLVEGCPVA